MIRGGRSFVAVLFQLIHAARAIVFISDSRDARIAAVRDYLGTLPAPVVIEEASGAAWPFQRHVTPRERHAHAQCVVWVRDLHLAFPSGQLAGTRLVLTQSTYQLQRWLDWLAAAPNVLLIADACLSALRRSSPEAFAGRGPWHRIDLRELAGGGSGGEVTARDPLHAAFAQADPERRFETCRAAAESSPDNPAVHLALGSVCMERQLLDAAEAPLARALEQAPDWEAAHFELGKLRLRREDSEGAAAAFAEAARLMPHFSTALLNLGGALGELGRGEDALDALRRARASDPRSHTILNNIGAVHREAGRLDDAAAAFREVIALAPAFVFGYYNLGHTLFLRGDFDGARRAYEEGFVRDPQQNARQACRLAVTRAAAGDANGAIELLEEVGEGVPPERTRELFDEAESTLDALSATGWVDAAALARVRAVVRRYSS